MSLFDFSIDVFAFVYDLFLGFSCLGLIGGIKYSCERVSLFIKTIVPEYDQQQGKK